MSVHISFTHPPSAFTKPMGAVAFAIGLKLLVPTPGKHGLAAVKDFIE
ncbi:MAG TPA: hypothetical protein VJ750_09690 [Rhizomicrobium sp.]|nr:hypothetical protein [Rhizomicrobium sp.]